MSDQGPGPERAGARGSAWPAAEDVQDAVADGPAPGWYVDDNGVIRWWNGSVWDVGAPPPAADLPPLGIPQQGSPPPGFPQQGYPQQGYAQQGYAAPMVLTENRSLALLAHLGAFFGGFVLPLILMVTAGKTDPFVRYHATESLNFQLTYLAFSLGGVVLSIATLGFGLIVFLPLMLVAAVVVIVFSIQGCMAANRGEWYRYPICIRFVKFS